MDAEEVDEGEDPIGWHVISGVHLLDLLTRCSEGESPDLVFAEMWANAEHHSIEEDE